MIEAKPGNARILRDTSDYLELTLYVDGAATDADANPTVTVTKADGTAVLTNAATTKPANTTGIYRVAIPAAQTVSLNQLIAAWTATVATVVQKFTSRHDVVGGHLFTIADARAYDSAAMADQSAYPLQAILEARDRITDLFEDYTGISWVPRFKRRQVTGQGSPYIRIPEKRLIRLLSATIDGTALDSTALTNVILDDERGILTRKSGAIWQVPTSNPLNVVLEYEYGEQSLVDGVGRMALKLLRRQLVPSPISDRTMSFTGPDGMTERFSRFSPTGDPEVDAWIDNHTIPLY